MASCTTSVLGILVGERKIKVTTDVQRETDEKSRRWLLQFSVILVLGFMCIFIPLGEINLNFYGKYLFRITQMHTVCVASNHNRLKDRGRVWRGNAPNFLFQTFSIPIWTTNLPVTLKFFKALSNFVKDKKGRALPPLKLYCLYHSKKKKSSPKDFFFCNRATQ